MSSRYCTTYGCGRQTGETYEGKPYCRPCVSQFSRGLARAANDSLKELNTLRDKIITIGLGGKEE